MSGRARLAAVQAAAALGAACGLRGDGIAGGRIRNLVVVTFDTTRADRLGA